MRLLMELEGQSCYQNMAEDEAIMNQDGGLTLRLYRWRPRAISIGYSQSLEDEVDLDFCKEQGIDVVRRTTGGGAVFHDEELTYSVLVHLDEWNDLLDKRGETRGIANSFRILCGPIVQGLQRAGVEANFRPLNDVEIHGKKISGNAQTRREGYLLQHGTILLDLDLDTMFQALKVSDLKLKDKMIGSARERVTSAASLNLDLSHKGLAHELAEAYGKLFSSPPKKGKLSDVEERDKIRLSAEKYAQRWWNHLR